MRPRFRIAKRGLSHNPRLRGGDCFPEIAWAVLLRFADELEMPRGLQLLIELTYRLFKLLLMKLGVEGRSRTTVAGFKRNRMEEK